MMFSKLKNNKTGDASEMICKKANKLFILSLIFSISISCINVEKGHRGVIVYSSGKTELNYILPEGKKTGLRWLSDKCVLYDVREKTLVKKIRYNDSEESKLDVELKLVYRLNPEEVNLIHAKITDIDNKILKTLKSAGKEIVPQYTASELNLKKRKDAESNLEDIISNELPEFYVEFISIQISDIKVYGKDDN
jgi:hypothetical protein